MKLGRIRPQVVAALTQVPEVKRQVRAGAALVRDEARRIAPFRTGTLRRSLTVVNHYDPVTKMVEYRVGWNLAIAPYALVVEFGDEDQSPQPHLRPAANKFRGR